MVASNSAKANRTNKQQPPKRRPVSPMTWHEKPQTFSPKRGDLIHQQQQLEQEMLMGPPCEVRPLQFADYTVGLAFKHLPLLLVVTCPLSLLLLSIGSLWLLVIPCFSVQMVAIFLALDEAQGASLLLHVMTLLAVALSLFMFAPLLLFSWWYFMFYLLCVCSYICCNVLLHLTIDSVVEDDKETAITLEVVLMKFYPVVSSLALAWALFSSMPIPISGYCIVFYLLLVLVCFCYPHRSSFADPTMHADAILAYSDATILSLSDWLVGLVISLALPMVLALVSLQTLSVETAFVHAILQQAIVIFVLSYSPCLEILKYTEVIERRRCERWMRYSSAVVMAVSLLYFFFTLDGDACPLLRSQLCVSAVGAISLHYFLTHNYNHKISTGAVLFSTAVLLFQLLAVEIDHKDILSTPVESVYQIGLVLASQIIYGTICSKAANRALAAVPLMAFVVTWAAYASFSVSAAIASPLVAQIINITILLGVNGLYHSSSDDKYVNTPVYFSTVSLLAAVSVHLLLLPHWTPSANSSPASIPGGVHTLLQILLTCPSVASLLAPFLLAQSTFYKSFCGESQWKCAVMSVMSTTAHCLFGGMKVSAALYLAFMDYEPSNTVKIGLLLCVVTFSLYHIWCRYLESLLWLAFLACVASAGALIAITEPDIFNLRLCVSLGLVVFALIWLLVVTNVPSLVKSDQMLITTSLVSGFCFGSICALLFMPVPPSPKFVVMFCVYVTVCASSAFVVLYIWRLWVKQENVTSLSSFFKIIVAVNLAELLFCVYSESKMDLKMDVFATWFSPVYPCALVFMTCFAVNSAIIKWYQHKLANKYVHQKLSSVVERSERVFTCLAILMAIVSAPKNLLPIWIPSLTMLAYRPGMKPWMSKQLSSHLSFAPMMTLFTLLGFFTSVTENMIWGPSSQAWGGTGANTDGVVVSYWQQAMELYVPNYYVDQSELEVFDKVSTGKYTVGLGQKQMGFVGDNEDVNSLCLTVVHRLFQRQGYSPSDFGRLEVGTESILDRSKSVKSVLMQLFEAVNTDLEGVDCINACYGGTSALFNTVSWMESSSWDGRLGLVVAADIAIYAEGAARCTGGAGAVAMVVAPNAALVLDKGLRATHMKHVYDFYKPELHSEYPQVDGPLSVECYLSALDICYERYRQKYEKGSQTSSTKSAQNGDAAAVQTDASVCWPYLSLQKTFDAILFHTPFCKIVQKSLGRLMLSEFLNQMPHSLNDPKFEKLAKFEGVTLSNSFHNKALEKALTECSESLFTEKTLPGLAIAQRVGNMYTPSLYGSLISYLISKSDASELCGKRVAMFSYGSGMAATMYSLTLSSDPHTVLSLVQPLRDVTKVLDSRIKFSPDGYVEKLTHRETNMVNRKDFAPSDSVQFLQPHTYYLSHVDDKFRRHYKCHLGQ